MNRLLSRIVLGIGAAAALTISASAIALASASSPRDPLAGIAAVDRGRVASDALDPATAAAVRETGPAAEVGNRLLGESRALGASLGGAPST